MGVMWTEKQLAPWLWGFFWKTSPSALCWAITLDVHVDHYDVFISIFNTSHFLCSDMLLPCLPALFHPLQYGMFFLIFFFLSFLCYILFSNCLPSLSNWQHPEASKMSSEKSLLVCSEDSDIPFVSFHHRNNSSVWWTNLDFLTQLSQRSTPHRIFVKEDS